MKKIVCYIVVGILILSKTYAGSFEIYLENDVIVPKNEDNSYSHGTKFTWYYDGNFNEKGEYIEKGNTLAQFMYTPNDLNREDIIYGERPYAGVLYYSFLNRKSTKVKRETIEVQLGAIGSYSFVEETQTKIHEWTDSTIPLGWDNQIGDEFFGNTSYKVNRRFYKLKYLDLSYGYGGSIGNLYIGANIDTVIRFGILSDGFAPNMIEPMELKKSEIYLFVRVNERGVVHNTTLDGSLFKDEVYTVNSEPFVTELEGGIHYEGSKYYGQLSYIGRTDEFEGQDDNHTFGSIKLGTKW